MRSSRNSKEGVGRPLSSVLGGFVVVAFLQSIEEARRHSSSALQLLEGKPCVHQGFGGAGGLQGGSERDVRRDFVQNLEGPPVDGVSAQESGFVQAVFI